jgi:transposase
MPTEKKRVTRRKAGVQAKSPRPARGSGVGSSHATTRASELSEEIAPSPVTFVAGAPARSKTQSDMGPKERAIMRSVALDLGAKKISMCEVANGAVVRRLTVTSIESLKSELGPQTPPARVAIEACREAWAVAKLLTAWGNEIVLVDTTRVRQLGIGQHGRKTDRIDAEVLALALERNQIPRAHLLSEPAREMRALVGTRAALVQTRARYVAEVRGRCRAHGVKVPSCGADHFATNMAGKQLPSPLGDEIAPFLALLPILDEQIAALDAKLDALVKGNGVLKLLTTAPGVGPVVATAFASVIDDPARFRNAHEVESYIGLVPIESTTGGKRRLGSISKRGNPYLRSVLVQSAWIIMRTKGDDPMKQWARGVIDRRGNKCLAAIALARKLAGVLWAMWRDGAEYNPSLLMNVSARARKAVAAA